MKHNFIKTAAMMSGIINFTQPTMGIENIQVNKNLNIQDQIIQEVAEAAKDELISPNFTLFMLEGISPTDLSIIRQENGELIYMGPSYVRLRLYAPLHRTMSTFFNEITDEAIKEALASVSDNRVIVVKSPQLRLNDQLSTAISDNNAEQVKAILEAGANINGLDSSDCTPLSIAVDDENTEMIELLLSKGADIDMVNSKRKMTALNLATQNGQLEMVKLLLSRGADANKANFEGFTPLMLAVENRNTRMAELF